MGLRLFHGGKSNSLRSPATRKPLPEFSSGHISLNPIKDKIKGENEFDPNPASPSTLVVSSPLALCLSVLHRKTLSSGIRSIF